MRVAPLIKRREVGGSGNCPDVQALRAVDFY